MDIERQKKLITTAYTLAYEALEDVENIEDKVLDLGDSSAAIGPMAAEIYREMNRVLLVTVHSKGVKYGHLQHLRDVVNAAIPGMPSVISSENIEFTMIDEATIIPDSALEALETIAERIRERRTVKYPDGHTQDLPLIIILSKDTLWCPECKHQFRADVTMRENDPFPIHVATCPECDYIIGESEWNCIYSDPVIIHKMSEYERMLMETYCRVAHKHDNRIPVYTLLMNTASHPKGQGVIRHGNIVYPIEEHQMVIAVYKDSVEHLVLDGYQIELENMSLDQLLIYYASIGFMLHDMSLLKPANEDEDEDEGEDEADAIAARNRQRESVIEELLEYEKGIIEGFALYNDRQSRAGEEGSPRELFILVIDTATAKISRWTRHPIAFPLEIDEFAIRIEKGGITRYSYDMKKMALEGMPVDQLRAYLSLAKAIVAAASGEVWANAPSGEEEGENHEGEEAKRSP